MKRRKGTALIVILAIILAVVVVVNIAMVFMRTQFRFTHHKTSRIQAYYAAQAGINYALEKLRKNEWTEPKTEPKTYRLCRSGCDINELELPRSVQYVDITVWPEGSGKHGTRQITAKAVYTYTE